MKSKELLLSIVVLTLTFGQVQSQVGPSASPDQTMKAAAGTQASKIPKALGSARDKPQGRLTKAEDLSKICMVTNHAFDKPQIPVEINGSTYYGCCEMCKKVLVTNRSERVAIDPISQKKVDKSKAVIGVAGNGVAVYFENERHLEAYNTWIDQ